MARFPGAVWRPIRPQYLPGQKMSAYNRVNLHVAVSEAASLHGYFNALGRPSSHFYVRRDGTIEQYVDTAYRAEADLEGNDATISIETQGGVRNPNSEPWTAAQVEALAQIYAWAVKTHGIALQIAKDSRPGATSKGLSWHRLGIDPWRVSGGMRYSSKRGKVCPGNAKIAQVPTIFARAKAILDGGKTTKKPKTTATVLRRGSKGSAVRMLQREMNRVFPSYSRLAVDGSFGPATERVVREFQRRAGLAVDGIVGPKTRAALKRHGVRL